MAREAEITPGLLDSCRRAMDGCEMSDTACDEGEFDSIAPRARALRAARHFGRRRSGLS